MSQNQKNSLFEPGHNCWKVETAWHASVVVDCGNYYRDLWESISKAEHSIFITGWDIDSRIELLRDKKAKEQGIPVNLYELLTMKAEENPDLHIYLNRWNYAIFLAGIREPMTMLKWHKSGFPNLHFCHDDMTPVGACHHQKIVVIDDEVAYTGGMDVAIGRWDMRDHNPKNKKRADPGGSYELHGKHFYDPYHDIQTVMSGPAAQALAQISRERWHIAAGYEAIPMRTLGNKSLPRTWPDTDPPDFEDIPTAIARTVPPFAEMGEAYEIEKIYLDQIAQAENFIYIENQYLTRRNIARALNRRLKERPQLRVLLVSSFNPQGFVERMCMWTGRIIFKRILLHGGTGLQASIVYPCSRNKGTVKNVRIHSKLMIVDDRYLHIGSSNLNNRSMRLDTECDVIYEGHNDKARRKIADVRNDLIREHTGLEADDIERMVNEHTYIHEFLKPVPHSTQRLIRVNDMKFFNRIPRKIAFGLADPDIAPLPDFPVEGVDDRHFPRRRLVAAAFIIVAALLFIAAWKAGLLDDYGSREKLTQTFSEIEKSHWAIPYGIAIYVLCVMLFMPITLLTGVTAVIFGYWSALAISFIGSMISAVLGFFAGQILSPGMRHFISGKAVDKVRSYAEESSVVGMTFLRMIPIAPFSAVNIALGALHAPFIAYMAGTFLGLLPGKFVTLFIADSLGDLWLNPDAEKIIPLTGGILLWLGIVLVTHKLHRKWRSAHPVQA